MDIIVTPDGGIVSVKIEEMEDHAYLHMGCESTKLSPLEARILGTALLEIGSK